ncbi:hypothetical protein FZI91_03700 [Mycobacterium sp. CBMA271]|uniref:hypothetical protein n=1 Tax=unclassified Mycobacteroides TaxID=2618759 RepID=UPI0012DC74F0|nr:MULTISPECIES: hypothetical protein [unclassified Mycobacteroides]MUM20811.1 hypothetical protein [Mycobacteroides sp. CBMA 271]
MSARNMAEEAEVISVAERVVGKLSVRMQAMKDDLAQLERSVVESGGVLQDDAIVDWGRNPFPYDIHMQRLYLAKQATGLLKQASELDSATGSVLGRLSRLELRVTSFDIDPIKKNATIVDLKKLNRAGSMTIELESVVSAEQDAIDTRIKDKAPLWNGMESETDFTACCGWLDRRRSDRVAMMDGLIGTVIVTQKVFSAMEARNVERLVG